MNVGSPSDRLDEELARLRSNASREKMERAWRVLQAINDSNVPFNSHSAQYHGTASLGYYNLLDQILDCCSFRDIVAVSQLSSSLRVLARLCLNRQLISILKRYAPDAGALFQVMKQTGGVVSGSTALAFVDRGDWTSQDLDLYVPAGRPRDEFLMHLAGEGYDVSKVVEIKPANPAWYPYGQLGASVTRITKLLKQSKEDPSITTSIDLIESKSETSAIFPIIYFHATHVMN
ncbi:hypothetical protein FRC02_006393 [Tulasnella sp. 418]|nr:hypothetical protein FRC02_006393 [Tulasnella sp. 418]